MQQAQSDSLRQVYSWILGRLVTAGWDGVAVMIPYAVVGVGVILAHRRLLDALAVGDEEVAGLGVSPRRVRLVVVAAATLCTAAAVSAAGAIGFVGIIVPHTVRLLFGTSYRVVLPMSLLLGAAFFAGSNVRLAQAIVSVGEIAIEFKRMQILGDGVGIFVLVGVEIAQLQVRFGELGIERQRVLQ